MKFKKNDVFGFRYNQETSDKHFGDIYHCFEGLLVATENYKGGGLCLIDTFWGSGSHDRKFQINEAVKKGTLKFEYNLDDVEPIKCSTDYYDEKDIFLFTRQHGCTQKIFIKKGATYSKSKMAYIVNKKLNEKIHDVEYASREIERLKELQIRIEYFGLDGIYI